MNVLRFVGSLLGTLASVLSFFLVSTASVAQDKPTTFGLKPFPQKQILRIGYFAGGPFNAPFYIAEKEGFFKELNIEVRYETFTNGPAMMEAHSTWDIGSSGIGGTLVGMMGYDIKTIGIVDDETNIAVFVRPNSPLAKDPKKAENWKGTTWLYPIGTTAQAVLVKALQQVGLTMSDVKSVNMDVATALTGFKGNQGDGLVVWNTIAFSAEDAGYIRLGDAGTYALPTPATLMANKAAIEKKKELITTAYAVFYLTAEWINKNPENTKKAIQHFLKSTREEGLSVSPSMAERSMKLVKAPTMQGNYNLMTMPAPDASSLYSKRALSRAEKDMLYGVMEFFISEKKYSTNDRNKILDSRGIDPTIAIEANKLQGIGVK